MPFGAQYRIIDFTLSNCFQSGLRQTLVLTQYKPNSLHTHLQTAWAHPHSGVSEYVTAVPPKVLTPEGRYTGTANAVYQNIDLLHRTGAKIVIVLSGDHIYRMNYNDVIEQHEFTDADVTAACMEVSLQDARSLGVVEVDANLRIRDFVEKPSSPPRMPGKPDRSLASMGIYVFKTDILFDALVADARDDESTHDFGHDLMPRLIHSHRVFSYQFGTESSDRIFRYWRDVGTIDAYYNANMDLLCHEPMFDLHAAHWPIRKHEQPAPPATICSDSFGLAGEVINSILCNGVIVAGGIVARSILSRGVRVKSGAVVKDAVLLDGVQVGEGSVVRHCVIDKNVVIPAGETIGVDRAKDAARFDISSSGVVVVCKGYVFGQTQDCSRARPQVAAKRSHTGSLHHELVEQPLAK